LPEFFPVYVVDDDPAIRDWAGLVCEELGLACRAFAGGEEFLAALEGLAPGCILLDMRMPRPNGLAVQAELSRRGSRMPVIAMTGYGDVDVAVESMKLGALDFLEKPFAREVLCEALERGFRQLRGEDG
jgi:two-component system response regulator FixJ